MEKYEYTLCPCCNGTGEGSYDGSICVQCHGDGEILVEMEETTDE